MTLFQVVLDFHILTGTIGLIVGPVAMSSRKRKGLHTYAGKIYFWTLSLMCLSACTLAILHWETSGWFLGVAAFSYSFAFRGYRAAKKRGPCWLKTHITGMLGSYIAMVTALLVVNRENLPLLNQLPVWVTWILPTIVGSPLITWAQRRNGKLTSL